MRIFFILWLSLSALPVCGQTLSGVVTDSNNAAVEAAVVTLRSGPRVISRTESDAEGKFSIDRSSVAGTVLIVKAKGFSDFSQTVSGIENGPLKIVLSPAPLNEAVTVSVTRSETRLSETAASVVVLDRARLETTAAQTIDDSLRQIAGFTLFRRTSSKTANPTAQGANLRGVSGSGASRAAVLVDGLSLNDAYGGWTFWSRVPQIAVEQAEMLRGGASSFYGSGGLSGAVNLMTSRLVANEPIFRIQTSAGSQGTYDGSVFAAATKNGWGFDLAAETFQTAGYIPTAENERGVVDTTANSKHNNGIFTVERQFGSVPPAAAGGSTQQSYNARLFIRGNLFAERRDNGTSLTYNRTYFRQAAAGADLSSAYVGTVQFRSFVEAQVYDQTFSAVTNNRNTETLTRLQRVPSQAVGADLFWARGFGDHSVAASLEFREVRGFSDEVGFFAGNPTSLSGSGGRERTYSVFAQDLWRVSDKFFVNFGGRFDRWKNSDAHLTTLTLATNAVAVTPFPERSETAFSPRIAALYQLNKNASLYGSFSRSFRAPTLNELYRSFRVGNVVTQANENLSAERANTFESGALFSGFGNRLSLRGNVFVTEVSDPIVSVTLSSTPTLITRQRQNVGQTRTRGIELDADIAATRDVRVSMSYLLADSRLTKFPANPDLVGKFLPQIARQQLNFQVTYRPSTRFSLGIQARISDSQFEDDLNTFRLRPYFTLHATAAYRIHKKLEVFAATENIFNSHYDIGLTPNRTVAAPRFVRVGLRFDLAKR